jgi:hypothetical protein
MSDYDPPASELVGSREVAEELNYTIHGVLNAMREGRLWCIVIDGRRFTTWRAVSRWNRTAKFRPGRSSHATGTTTGTESGADRKHATATGHATSTTVRAETAARWAGGK